MNLIDQIEDPASPLAGFLAARLPFAAAIAAEASASLEALPTLRPGPGAPHELLASALVYRVRFHLASPAARRLPAWMFALRLGLGPAVQDIGPFEAFFDGLDEFVARIEPVGRRLELRSESQLCRYALALARIEALGRDQQARGATPPGVAELVQDLHLGRALDQPPYGWVQDLEALSRAFHGQRYRLGFDAVDVLPELSGDEAAGADEADLVSGDLLAAVHTTVYPQIQASWLLRATTRALLDRGDDFGLRRVGIYLSRQGHWLEWSLDELLYQASAGGVSSTAELREELAAVHAVPVASERRISQLFRRRGRVTKSPHPNQLKLPFHAA